jgi:mono/diheme cytochrome c family protein
MKKGIVFFVLCLLTITFSSFQKKTPFDLKASISRGQEIYSANCIACHMEKGEGLEGVYPPLAKSDYLMADKKRSIIQVLNGVKGPMKVNRMDYDGEMAGFELSDNEVSDVLNYVRNSFGNKGGAVLPTEVLAARK